MAGAKVDAADDISIDADAIARLRIFPHSLEAVYKKLSLAANDVLNVYLMGSRLWGTATATSDYDLYIVVRGATDARSTHLRVPGAEVDAVVIGARRFQERLDSGKLKELSCVWAPAACRIVEKQPLAPEGGRVAVRKVSASLHETFDKDWPRAEKLVTSGRVREGLKVVAHCVRAHLLALQILEHGCIRSYTAGVRVVDTLRGCYVPAWATYDVVLAPELRAIRDVVTAGGAVPAGVGSFAGVDEALLGGC